METVSPQTLDQIIELALLRNLDMLVLDQELEIQREQATGEKLRMLPSLTVSGELSERDKDRASTSSSVITGVTFEGGTISSERITKRWDITMAWNICHTICAR